MKDIHCHILYGIDDGASTIEEAIEILKKAQNEGITDIVLTPHYIKDTKYNVNNREKKKLLTILNKKKKEENININLYLGNEVMIDKDVLELIKKGEIRCINNTRYLLIEFSLRNESIINENIIFDLVRHGIVPILAHPERYIYFQKNINEILKYVELGALLQGNYQSLLGKYGRNAKKVLTKLLKNKSISFLASDIHKSKQDYNLDKLNKKLKRIVKDDNYIKEILEDNFDKVINNIEI